MLEVRGLHKRYGDLVAVDEVSFTARPGEMVGLLGPNGAGKTTTVSMIAGLLRARSRRGADRRRRGARRDRPGQAAHGLRAAGSGAARRAVGARKPGALRRALRHARRGAARARWARALRDGRAGRPRQGPRRHLQRRHEAAPEPGRGAAARPADPAAGRAHRRRRPAEPQRRSSPTWKSSSGRARRWSTPRTTWKRRSACATASSSSITAR